MSKFLCSQVVVALMTTLASASLYAEDSVTAFEFDRPGQAISPTVAPKGHLAWEQALPSMSYDRKKIDGQTYTQLNIQGDVLLRAGIGHDTELRLGWDGPMWKREKLAQQKRETDGVGDVRIGVKKAIDLNDEASKWAVLAQVQLAVGDDGFSEPEDIYTLGSTYSYQFSSDITTGITMLYDYQDGDLAVTAIPNIQYPIAGNVTGFSEYVLRKKEHHGVESVIQTGLSWLMLDRLQFDGVVGYSLSERNPDFNAGLGVSYLF